RRVGSEHARLPPLARPAGRPDRRGALHAGAAGPAAADRTVPGFAVRIPCAPGRPRGLRTGSSLPSRQSSVGLPDRAAHGLVGAVEEVGPVVITRRALLRARILALLDLRSLLLPFTLVLLVPLLERGEFVGKNL